MSDRWIPVVAAIVGVLGGMGGAFVGGYIANKGQQQRFEEERKTQVQDLRRETYVQYLQKADAAVALTFTEPRPPENSPPVVNAAAQVRSARAQVLIVSSNSLRSEADELYASLNVDEGAYERARERFIVAAVSQLTDDGP
jgi:hypothetical protein